MRRLVRQVEVPVLVNGEIDSVAAARDALRATNAAGVMIGRGALGQPWIFRELTGGMRPSLTERWSVMLEHVQMMHEFYGEDAGVRIARKHVLAYFERFDMKAAAKPGMALTTAADQLRWLRNLTDLVEQTAA